MKMSSYYDSSRYDGGKVEFGSPYPYAGEYRPRDAQQVPIQPDAAVVARALNKLRSFSIIAMILAFLTIVSGATTLGVAAKNIGFPVFNFGPLLVGIIFFICGSVGYSATKKALDENQYTQVQRLSYAKCGIVAVFSISVASISLSILSGVFAFISGAVCAGADIVFYSRNNNVRTRIDVKQYCSPNDTANTVLAFIDGVLCILIAIWCIVGTSFFCCYGRHFGIKSRRRGC